MAQPRFEVSGKRVAINVFDGAVGFMGLVIFASASGFSEIDPIAGTVAGSFKALSVHKGLQPIDWVMIESLPITREELSAFGQ